MIELKVSVQWPAGSIRTGTSSDGTEWHREMTDHYGEIPGTVGSDGDPLDVYVNPRCIDHADVYVVTQLDASTGKVDEEKFMLGYPDIASAESAYRRHYPKNGRDVFGGIRKMSQSQFVESYDVVRKTIRDVVASALRCA